MLNVYNDLNVFDTLDLIGNGEIIVPDFQRDYCWTPEDIEKLFLSVIEGFPIGSFIFWKPKGDFLNNCSSTFYKLFDKVYRNRKGFASFYEQQKCDNKSFENTTIYNVVLDGQQRLTSFYLALKGSYYVKTNSGFDNKIFNYEEKNLYYNLDKRNPDSITSKTFVFLTKEEANEGNFFRVKDVMMFLKNKHGYYDHVRKATENIEDDNQSYYDLCYLFDRLSEEGTNQSLIHHFSINKESYDDALDIFIRVNSTGVKLNKTDLMFGKLINGWENTSAKDEGKRKEIEKYIRRINSTYEFDFTKDYLLRAAMLISNNGKAGLSMNEISKESTIQNIRSIWDSKITKSIETAAKIMKEIGLYGERIISYNALMPIIYFISLGGTIKTVDAKIELRKYMAISFARRLFGASSDSVITRVCGLINANYRANKAFSMNLFELSSTSSREKIFRVSVEEHINKWMEYYNKGPKTYPFLMLLSPNLDFAHTKYDQDHSHADSLFNDKTLLDCGVKQEELSLWKEKRNHLANLSFMEYSWNRSKSKTDLNSWILNNPDKVSSLVLLPKDTSFELKNFKAFYIRRRSMMKYELTKLFGVLKENIDVGNEITVNEAIGPKQDSNMKISIEKGMHGIVLSFQKMNNRIDNQQTEYALVALKDENGNDLFQSLIPSKILYLVEEFDKQY